MNNDTSSPDDQSAPLRPKREIIRIDCVTHRRDPIYHTIIPAALEHLLMGSIPREATLLLQLQQLHHLHQVLL